MYYIFKMLLKFIQKKQTMYETWLKRWCKFIYNFYRSKWHQTLMSFSFDVNFHQPDSVSYIILSSFQELKETKLLVNKSSVCF